MLNANQLLAINNLLSGNAWSEYGAYFKSLIETTVQQQMTDAQIELLFPVTWKKTLVSFSADHQGNLGYDSQHECMEDMKQWLGLQIQQARAVSSLASTPSSGTNSSASTMPELQYYNNHNLNNNSPCNSNPSSSSSAQYSDSDSMKY